MLAARANPELAYAYFNLLFAAWHEIPAGSLPFSEEILGKMAGISRRRWHKISDVVMAEFMLATDGRYYHLDLCEEAEKSWKVYGANQRRGAAMTAARLVKNGHVPDEVTVDVTLPVTGSQNNTNITKQTSDYIFVDLPPGGDARTSCFESPARQANAAGGATKRLDPSLLREFEDFWAVFPNNSGRLAARWAWQSAREHLTFEAIMEELQKDLPTLKRFQRSADGWLFYLPREYPPQ